MQTYWDFKKLIFVTCLAGLAVETVTIVRDSRKQLMELHASFFQF